MSEAGRKRAIPSVCEGMALSIHALLEVLGTNQLVALKSSGALFVIHSSIA